MLDKTHIHTFRRIKNQPQRYMCTAPACNYVNNKDLLHGKFAQCPYCKEKYVLKARHLKLALPHCGCINNTQESVDTAEELLVAEKLIDSLGDI